MSPDEWLGEIGVAFPSADDDHPQLAAPPYKAPDPSPAPGECGVRKVVVPNPGTRTNYVVLKSGPDTPSGIIFITNVGKCQVFVHSCDANGTPLDVADPLALNPGDYAPRFIPPANSAMIIALSDKDCDAYSAITYDPCAGIS